MRISNVLKGCIFPLLAVTFFCSEVLSVQSAELARVNDVVIDDTDFEIMLKRYPSAGNEKVDREKLLDMHINDLVLSQEAEKDGLDQDPTFKRQIELIRRALLARKYMQSVVRTKNTEEARRKYLNENAESYTIPLRVRAAAITLQKTEEDAKEIFENVLDRVKNGDDFGEMAKEMSVHSYAKRGGDFGLRTKEDLAGWLGEKTADLAFSMKKDEIKGPIKDKGGFHIVKVIDREEEHVVEFEKAKKSIWSKLNEKIKEEEIEKLRSNSKIHVDKELLNKIAAP